MKKLLICFCVCLFVSCHSKENEISLIDDFSLNIPFAKDIDDLLGKNVKAIQLDTTTEALVGGICKIIKHESHFFILCEERRILHFDHDGKYISSLDKKGGGPGEYSRIDDFNLLTINGNTELWICDVKRIRKYNLSGNSWHETGTIDFDFTIHKFKIISNKYILFLTGLNEPLLLTDITGEPLHSYPKKEIPYPIYFPIQFVDYESFVVYKLGASNECIALDTKDFSVVSQTN